jgi:hypothetical protein
MMSPPALLGARETSFILVPAEVPKSLLAESLPRHGTGRGAPGLHRQALEPAADPALCGVMALNAGAVNYDERGATSKNHDSFTALLTGA